MGAIDVDLYLQVREATAVAINAAAYDIYLKSQREVPKAVGAVADRTFERYGETLAMSGRYGGPVGAKPGRTSFRTTDISLAATPQKLEASVVYEGPHALAQHEGEMVYHRDGKSVEWVVKNYTTSGTKSHYLSDPAKAVIPLIPGMIAEAVGEVLARFDITNLAPGAALNIRLKP